MAKKKPQTPASSPAPSNSSASPSVRTRLVIGAVIGFAIVLLLALKFAEPAPTSLPVDSAPAGESVGSGADPVASYEEALGVGKPIYVLFHSKTCEPCLVIEEVAGRVVPEYADRITYVDVLTDDPRSRPLFASFAFQYIPTSFFLAPDGTVIDQFTGVLQDAEMRQRLDALISASDTAPSSDPES